MACSDTVGLSGYSWLVRIQLACPDTVCLSVQLACPDTVDVSGYSWLVRTVGLSGYSWLVRIQLNVTSAAVIGQDGPSAMMNDDLCFIYL